MMLRARRLNPAHGWRRWSGALLWVGLLSANLLAARADDAPEVSAPDVDVAPSAPLPGTASVPHAAAPGGARRPSARARTPAQRLDDSIRRLTRVLDLDPAQQQNLRQILVDQHRQLLGLRNHSGAESIDVAATTMAIYDQTRERIRGILTDAQQQKYSVDVPRSELAPAQADLKHWMEVQEAGRRQALSEGEAK